MCTPSSRGGELRCGEYRRHRQFLIISFLARGMINRGNSRLMLGRSHRRNRRTEIRIWFLNVKKVLVWLHSVSPSMVMLIVGQLSRFIIAASQSERSEPNRSRRSPTSKTEIIWTLLWDPGGQNETRQLLAVQPKSCTARSQHACDFVNCRAGGVLGHCCFPRVRLDIALPRNTWVEKLL